MRQFSARETAWLQELDGIELAGFRRRAFAFLIDWVIVGLTLMVVLSVGGIAVYGIARLVGHPIELSKLNIDTGKIAINTDASQPAAATPQGSHDHIVFHLGMPSRAREEGAPLTGGEFIEQLLGFLTDIVVPVLYFGILLWRGKGQTPGKRWMKIRVVSIVHPHLSFWHSVERALGYGAAALEAGFGFVQFWLHPYRRCAQDRLAETIVVTERGYQKMLATKSDLGASPTLPA